MAPPNPLPSAHGTLCSAQDVFDVLMQPSRAQIWTQAAAVVSPAAGSELSLYGGNVAGKTVDAVPGKRIHQQWRLQSWPAGTRGWWPGRASCPQTRCEVPSELTTGEQGGSGRRGADGGDGVQGASPT